MKTKLVVKIQLGDTWMSTETKDWDTGARSIKAILYEVRLNLEKLVKEHNNVNEN